VLPVQLAVRVLDAFGAALAGVTVGWSTPDPTGSFPSGASSQTDATGLAVATWRLGTTVGSQTAQAAVGGPAPVSFTATATAGGVSATLSTITATPAQITAGNASGIVVTARDAGGNPVSGAAVVLAVTGGGTLTQPVGPTNASGVATGVYTSTAIGSKVISATVAGVLLAQTATVTVVAGLPVAVAATTATSFAVRFGQLVTPTPSVLVTDGFGNPVAGASVAFAVIRGAGSLTGASASTGSNGVAAPGSWLVQAVSSSLGTLDVYNNLRGTVAGGGIAGNPVTFFGTASVRYNNDITAVVNTFSFNGGCAGGGCHGGAAPSLTYGFLVNGTNTYVAYLPPDSTVRTSTYNRLLAKITGVVAHSGGTYPARIVTLFAAWIKQGVPQF
jgi:hypothetical protein